MISNSAVDCSIASSDERLQWDAFVATHPESTPYHYYAWIAAVIQSYSQSSFSIIAKDASSGEVVGIFPLVGITIPLKGTSLFSLPYCDIGYPLSKNEHVTKMMLEFAVDLCKQQKISTLQVRALGDQKSEKDALVNKKVRMLMPLKENAEELLASFKSKLRSQIKKAEKNGLTVKTGLQPALLKDFYSVYTINMRDLGSPSHHINWFSEIIKEYDNQALISVVYLGETPVGAGIVLKSPHLACIPWASTVREYNRLAPNMMLYWSILAHCADAKIPLFDFGRSTFEEGTYRFKKQWGAQPQLLTWQEYTNSSTPNSASNAAAGSGKIRMWLESIWRKLPLFITIKIGAFVRPYISL